MALFTIKMYPQPTTTQLDTSKGGRFATLIERTRAVISVILDVGRLIDRGATFVA